MEWSIDSARGPMRDGDGVRGRVLALTSALRLDLQRGAAVDAGEVTTALQQAGSALVDEGARAQLGPLVRAAHGLRELAGASGVDALLHAVGVVEQVLDGCLEGMDPDQLERLCRPSAAREVGLDLDGDEPAPPPVAAPAWQDRPAPARASAAPPSAEDELFDAFVAEALDALDRCEDALLREEWAPSADGVAAARAELATIADAAAAVGVHDLDCKGDTPGALLEALDAARQQLESAWADSPAAAIDPSALLPLDELFLRLRRAARDVAQQHGARLALTTHGGALRITAALAGRIYEPLARLVADAAAAEADAGGAALRLRAERDERMLTVVVDAGDDGAALPEAMHWIDARRPASDDESARLSYRAGFVNVVQVVTA